MEERRREYLLHMRGSWREGDVTGHVELGLPLMAIEDGISNECVQVFLIHAAHGGRIFQSLRGEDRGHLSVAAKGFLLFGCYPCCGCAHLWPTYCIHSTTTLASSTSYENGFDGPWVCRWCFMSAVKDANRKLRDYRRMMNRNTERHCPSCTCLMDEDRDPGVRSNLTGTDVSQGRGDRSSSSNQR